MRGKKDPPMHDNPFDLIHCQVLGEDGKSVFKKALWLLLTGKRRNEFSLKQAYEDYRQRVLTSNLFSLRQTSFVPKLLPNAGCMP